MNAPERPYVGLRYFEERDAHLFYGRDEHVVELLGKLAHNRFVAVLGASGSGKSSFVRAGLLPELRAGMIPHAGPRWKVVEFKPGRAPLGELGDALRKTLNVENARGLVEEGPLGIARAVQAAQLDNRTNVLVIADQFEEVFRFQREDAARALEEGHALARRLLDAAAQTDVPIYVLLVMRSDYLGECAQFPELPERMSESLYLVPRLRRDQLQESITAPVGGRIEPAVVQRLLAEVGSDPDQLPRLQHLLRRMWDISAGQTLTMAHYDAAGGWTQGLEQQLEDVFRTVPEDVCRKVFQQLSELDKGRAVRRRASPGELTEVAGPGASSVVDAFRAEGFVLPQADPVDLTHECILRDWSRIRGWLEDEQRDAKRLRELAEAARDAGWPDLSKAQPIEGLQLQNLLAWRKDVQPTAAWAHRYGVDFTAANEYLTWSQQRDDERRAAREALQRQLQEETAARLRRTRWMLGLSGLFLALLAGLGWMFYTQKREAQARQLASRSELVFQEHAASLESATLLSISSIQARPTKEGYQSLRRQSNLLAKTWSTAPHEDLVNTVAFSPDDRWVATGSLDRTARVVETATGKEVFRITHADAVEAVAFSPDGMWLATGTGGAGVFVNRGEARVMEVATRKELFRITHEGAVHGVTFSPDSRYVATASYHKVSVTQVSTRKEVWHLARGNVTRVTFSQDGKWVAIGYADPLFPRSGVRVVEAATGKEVWRLSSLAVQALAFSPDGKRLALGTGELVDGRGEALLVEATTGKEVWRLPFGSPVNVAFSPDGRWLATGAEGGAFAVGEVRVVEAATGKEVSRLASGVSAVAFSPDGKWLATGSADKTARLMRPETGKEVVRLPHPGPVAGVVFSPNARWLATVSHDKFVRVMQVANGHEVYRVKHGDYPTLVALSLDRKWVATGTRASQVTPGEASVMEAATGKDVWSSQHWRSVTALAFSPDGKWLATGTGDIFGIGGEVRVTEVVTGNEVFRSALAGSAGAVVISPDGKWLVVGTGNLAGTKGGVRVMEALTGNEISRIALQRSVRTIVVSPDSKSVAVGTGNFLGTEGEVRVMEALTGNEIFRVALQGSVTAMVFSPDGKSMAVGCADKTTRLIEAATGEEVFRVVHKEFVRAVSFTPDGKWLATASVDGEVRLVESAAGKEVSRLTHPGRVNAVVFSRDGKWLATAGDDGTALVAEAATGEEFHRFQVDDALAISFTPDGRFLEIWHADGANLVLTRHPLHPDDLIQEACQKLTRNLTVAEWRQYVGKETPYQRSCDNLPYPPDYGQR